MPREEIAVLALDPGMTTGVAWFRSDMKVLRDVGPVSRVKSLLLSQVGGHGEPTGGCGQVTGSEMEQVDRLMRFAYNQLFPGVVRAVIVSEHDPQTFHAKSTKHTFIPHRINAMVEYVHFVAAKYVASIGGVEGRKDVGVRLVRQSPASGKGVVTDARLRNWGLWQVGQPHANDALRHLIVFLRKEIGNG